MNTPQTQRLLDRVGVRQYTALLGRHFHRAWLGAAGAALLVLLAARLLAFVSEQTVLVSLCALAVLPLLFSLVATRRQPRPQIARIVDERTGSKELFLTAAMIDQSPGDFQAIVVDQAEQRAGTVQPATVVPFRWQRGARDILLSSGLVAAAFLWLPQLDPFSKQEERDKIARQREQLEQTKKATTVRAEQIKEESSRENDRVEKALAALEKTFKEAKPQEREANLQKLAEQQKEIGELWRKASNEQRKDAFDRATQQFGAVDPQRVNQWREELKKGDLSSLKKELNNIREELQKLSEMPDSAEKRAAQERVAQKLGAMAEGMKQTTTSPQLQAALQRAMQQLELAKLDKLSKEGLEAAQESLNLSEKELEQLAQAMKDLQNLEDALKNMQMAKQLADQNKLDGEACKECEGMGDYAALYAKLLDREGGNGPGMGPNPGQGAGGKAPENDETETGFQQEKSPTKLAGGRMLLQWKVDEVGPTGARAEDYRNAVQQVKQGVSEAITTEQVPPGYHDAIQKYFDSLPEK